MIENADGCVEIIHAEHVRRASVSHKCRECFRDIRIGEQYKHTVYKFDGELVNYKICLHCAVAAEWLQKECDGWVYTQIEDDIREHVFEGHYGMPLARIAVGMDRHWTKRNGDLMPIPACPLSTFEKQKAATHE